MTSSPNKPTFYVNADELEHIPTPPVIHVAVKKSQKVNFISGVDKSNKPSGTPYAGSTDFYKAYDPDEVAQSGQRYKLFKNSIFTHFYSHSLVGF